MNDKIDKDLFSDSAFTLKFSSVDDIVQEIHKLGDSITMSKIYVAQAFRNLHVDPADAMKLGVKWQDDVYVDAAAVLPYLKISYGFNLVSGFTVNSMASLISRNLKLCTSIHSIDTALTGLGGG